MKRLANHFWFYAWLAVAITIRFAINIARDIIRTETDCRPGNVKIDDKGLRIVI